MVTIALPWPPSINHYWRHVGNRTLISREGRDYRERVFRTLARRNIPTLEGRLAVAMNAWPPDRRRRDLDNLPKAVLDACQHASLYADDSQVDLLLIKRCEPRSNAVMDLQIQELPLTRCLLCGQEMI